jgi:hypothetical protein
MDPDEAGQDLQTLRTVAGGLTRERDAIYVLLAAIYEVGQKWRSRGVSKKFREAILRKEGVSVDRRAKRSVFRLLIELTYSKGVKLRSRYANALEYARLRDCSTAEVGGFLRSRGIEKCARKYVAYRKQLAQSE